MQEPSEIIDIYLKMYTNYALVITGDWGIGKTYYVKNVLKNQITHTPVYCDASKNYKLIQISLFGLKSIEEIQTQIFLGLFPILKNKKVKLGLSLGKALIKSILAIKGSADFTEYFSEIDIDKNEWIKFEELVLCFDDLERKSSDLKLEELIGYINSLVESDNIKVLIITNENKIDDTNYDVLKEKVIGNTIEFNPVISTVFDNILNEKFISEPTYKFFLEKNKEFILNIFSKNSNNLRILIFALSYFQNIFSEIQIHLFKDDILKRLKDEILLLLLKFSLAISIEYKKGKINFKNCHGIDNDQDINLTQIMNYVWNKQNSSSEEMTPKKYSTIFLENYYKESNYYFYKPIYNYITGGSAFNCLEMIEELKKEYHIEKNEVLPQYEIYNELGYDRCFNLSNKEYKKLTRILINHAYKGEFNLDKYVSIFHFAVRFNNPLGLNLDTLKKRLIIGLHNGISDYKYNGMLGHVLRIDNGSEHIQHLLDIKSESLKINNKIQEKNYRIELGIFEQLCYTDFEDFYKQLTRDHPMYYAPYFSNFNPHKFYSLFIKSDNTKRLKIIRFINSRNDILENKHKQEIEFYTILKNKASKNNLKYKGQNIRGYIWEEFDTALQRAIDKLNYVHN